jgi:hypothetical protein
LSKPDFLTLEALAGNPQYRLVNGSWMDREEYEMCGWHVVGEYTEAGKPQRYWKAELDGLQRYGRLVHQRNQQRKAAWQDRDAVEDEFTAYVNALEDAKPGGNR